MEFDAREQAQTHQSQKDMIGIADILLLFRRFWISHMAAIIIGASLAACYAFYFFPKDLLYNNARYTISVANNTDKPIPLGSDHIKRVLDYRLLGESIFARSLKEELIRNHRADISEEALQILGVDRLEQETPDTVTIIMRMPLELQADISTALVSALNTSLDQIVNARASRLNAEEDKVFASYLTMTRLSLDIADKVKAPGERFPSIPPLSWNPGAGDAAPNILQLLAIAVRIPDADKDKAELISSFKMEYFSYLRNLDDLQVARREFSEFRGLVGLVFTHARPAIQESTFANRRFSRVVRFSVAGAVAGFAITFLIVGFATLVARKGFSRPNLADGTQ